MMAEKIDIEVEKTRKETTGVFTPLGVNEERYSSSCRVTSRIQSQNSTSYKLLFVVKDVETRKGERPQERMNHHRQGEKEVEVRSAEAKHQADMGQRGRVGCPLEGERRGAFEFQISLGLFHLRRGRASV